MTPPHAAPKTSSGAKAIQTILLVEDEVLMRFPLAEYLRDRGYRVFEASNVGEAKAVLAADTTIDLVFSDVHMPGNENGFAPRYLDSPSSSRYQSTSHLRGCQRCRESR